jgi:hypothetical protein
MLSPTRSSISLLALALCAQSPQRAAALPARPVLNQTVPATPPTIRQNMRLLADGQRGKVAQFIEYQDGKLHIVAEDSTLDGVLQAISQVTGARIDLPAGLQPERIAVTLGPAPMADVVRALLDSSRFNYVILGSPAHPEAIGSIVIKLRNPSNAPVQAASAMPGTNQPGLPGAPVAGQPLAKDFYGQARLPNSLTPQEAALSRQELYQKYMSAQQNQRQQQQLIQQQQLVQQQQLLQQQQLIQQQQQQQLIRQQEQAQEMGNPTAPQEQEQ